MNNQGQNPPYPSRNANSQLDAVQARIEGPSIAQGRLEAPEPQARIYAYTKGDAEGRTSRVVTGQISITTYDAIALFDSCATHSFVSLEFTQKEIIFSDPPIHSAGNHQVASRKGFLFA
ncbi:hypothetical protein TIFTF001_033161 [Ficus carica]|uniref:Uncharacterized protein n=1 Tax=Ficus carica TaxID=3494 RepID=A0AA88J6S5_FICCA|nr:hypothetical protein TIFTF001_033161 [Ficus carica]